MLRPSFFLCRLFFFASTILRSGELPGPSPFRHVHTAELLPQAAHSVDHEQYTQAERCPAGRRRYSMATIDRKDLDQLERRELQLTIVAAVFVFVLASGLAVFMYPLVFVHPETGNKWTLRVAFFGFCALILLFIGYLFDRQRTVRKLKQQVLEELERNLELRLQASAEL